MRTQAMRDTDLIVHPHARALTAFFDDDLPSTTSIIGTSQQLFFGTHVPSFPRSCVHSQLKPHSASQHGASRLSANYYEGSVRVSGTCQESKNLLSSKSRRPVQHHQGETATLKELIGAPCAAPIIVGSNEPKLGSAGRVLRGVADLAPITRAQRPRGVHVSHPQTLS